MPDPQPEGLPLIEPAEAIAIGLSIQFARQVNPEGLLVSNILEALRLAGWEIVPAQKSRPVPSNLED
jgi:hypothetical protein